MSSSLRLTLSLLMILLFVACGPRAENASPLNRVDSWFILLDYSPDSNPVTDKEVSCYRMAILDPDNHPDLSILSDHAVKIAYLSVGEAEDFRSYWPDIKSSKWILGQNENWPGDYLVDPTSSEWRNLLLEKVIPEIVGQGFQGLMLDMLDAVDTLAQQDPGKAQEYQQGMIELVFAIHSQFPQLLLISNNGFTILNEIAPALAGLLVEGLFWMPDFEKGGYKATPHQWTRDKIAILTPLMESYYVPVFDLEYIDPAQHSKMKKISKDVRQLGYKPYFAEKELNQFYQPGNKKCH
jgi:polysaccharide biosynthesis protein PelA